MSAWLHALAVTGLFVGLWLQVAAFVRDLWAQACTCSKGKVCAKCLAESEAIHTRPQREAA